MKVLKKILVVIVILVLLVILIIVSNYVDIPGSEGIERRLHVINIVYPGFIAITVIYIAIFYIKKAYFSHSNSKKEDKDTYKNNK